MGGAYHDRAYSNCLRDMDMKRLSICLAFPLMACTSTPTPDTYSGYYRQGFEQSDFYTSNGEGPIWLDGTEAVFTQLQDYLVPKQGRGSFITVKMTVEGQISEKGEFGHIGRYPKQLYATRIVKIESISPDIYDSNVQTFRVDASGGQ